MKIYETSVRKPISTILIFVGVIIFGLFSVQKLGIDMYPDIDFPSITVLTTYQGANAADIETNLTKPIEDGLNTVENLDEITSRSSDNVSVVSLKFEWGTDLDVAANDIRDALGLVEGILPDDADKPILFKLNSSMMPVLFLSVTADESYAALEKILDEKLVNPLNRLPGIGAVSLSGSPVRQVQVNVDPRKIEAYGLSVEQIGQMIAGENKNVPSGSIDIGDQTFNIKSDSEFESSDELSNLYITSVGGRDILLSDIATIKDTLEKATIDERINTKRGVKVVIQKQSGGNTVQVAEAVVKALPEIQKNLPPDVKVSVMMDSSETIIESINSLSMTVMFAFAFVILVILFFLGRWRATFIIAITIPVSLIVAFIYLYVTKSTINIISLSSISIAIGMVVDDAIVVLENITKHIERGSSPKEAAIYATNEVWLAVIATTLVVVAVFLPLTLLGGMAGIMFRELGWIVALVTVTSTVAAITLTPMLSAYMLKFEQTHTYKGIGKIFIPIDKSLDSLDNAYAKALKWIVTHRAVTITVAIAMFASSLLLLRNVPTEFFPATDNGVISADIELDQNVSLDYTTKVARHIDSLVGAKYPEIHIISASSGSVSSTSGNVFAAMKKAGSNVMTYMFRMPKVTERDRSIFEIADSIRADFKSIPEIKKFTVSPGGNSGGSAVSGGGSSIDIKVFGYDFVETDRVAREIAEKLRPLDGFKDVNLSRDDLQPEYNVKFDRAKLTQHGLTSATAATYVRNRINGMIASRYREDGDEYDIVVRYEEDKRRSLEDVQNIVVYNAKGEPVKVRDIAIVEENFAPPTIEREDRQRLVKVKTLLSGIALGDAVKEVDKVLETVDIPDSIYVIQGGSVEDQQESFSDMMALMVLIVILVYIVMATQFESFRMPFIIMFTLPFAFTGVFLSLALTNTPLSLIAFIGAIMLVGIVVKNGIVMVDFTNLLRERGETVNNSVINAGKSRLRPVLMTSLTTILGMLPLAFGIGEGSETWQPMGIAVVGGLTFSTILTLFVIPVVYTVFSARDIKKKRKQSSAKNKR